MPGISSAIAFGVAARILICAAGGFAVAWSISTAPIFWQQSDAEKVEKYINAGDSPKTSILAPLKVKLDAFSSDKWGRPSALRSSAVVQLWLLEQAVSGTDQKNVDILMRSTDALIRESLASSPGNSFLWLVLFWLENTRDGFSRAHLDYLRMSYVLGPNEGWVGLKRNRLAVAIFSALSPELADNAIREFARLVDSRYFSEAADILGGPGWPVRDKLASRLKDVDEVNRQTFDKTVFRRGYDISIPGIERPEWRPWQ